MQDLMYSRGAAAAYFLNSPRLPVKTETPWGGGEYSGGGGDFAAPAALDRSYAAAASHPYTNIQASGEGFCLFALFKGTLHFKIYLDLKKLS